MKKKDYGKYVSERKTYKDVQKAQKKLMDMLNTLCKYPRVRDLDDFKNVCSDAFLTAGSLVKFRYDAGDDGIFHIGRNLQSSMLIIADISQRGEYATFQRGYDKVVVPIKNVWIQLRRYCLDIFPTALADGINKSREYPRKEERSSYAVGLELEN